MIIGLDMSREPAQFCFERMQDYVLASFVCMAPGTIAYTYLGYAGREALAGGEGLIQKGLTALGLLALLAFLPRLIRRLRAVPSKIADEVWIEVPELAGWLQGANAPVVIDVRRPDEFADDLGHIPAALNLPVGEFETRLAEINVHKDDALVLVCRTDKRSATVAGVLRSRRNGWTADRRRLWRSPRAARLRPQRAVCRS